MAEPHPRNERVLRVAPSVFVLILMIAGLGFGYYYLMGHRADPPPVVSSLGPTITKVERLGLLTVMNVSVSDVLTLTGYSHKGVWLVKGDALIAVDMSKMQITDRNEQDKLITLTLPEPEVLHPRVDHEKTMTYDVTGDWLTMIPGWGNESLLRDAAMYHAQKMVEFAVRQPEYINQAKKNAELVLLNIFGFSGWYVTIRWEGDAPKAEAPAPAQSSKGVTAAQAPAKERPSATR
jgi:hypothetical protein